MAERRTFASNQKRFAMKEEIYYVVDSLGVSQPEVIEKASEPITNLFVEGGLAGMIAMP